MPGVKGFRNRLQLAQSQETAAQRLEKRTIRDPHPKGCWLWSGSHNQHGYGKFAWIRNGKKAWMYAHRTAWEVHRGPIPEGMHVLHQCDNTGCVNPDHLRLGTHVENMEEKFLRCRDSRALSPDTVREIRKAIEEDSSHGHTIRIGARFDVLPNVVSGIKTGRKYSYVK